MVRWVLMLALVPQAAAVSGPTPELGAAQIMARVAANQTRAEKRRSQYVYRQHILIRSLKTNRKLMAEESADYRLIPTANGTNREMMHLRGRYWRKGGYIVFDKKPVTNRLDCELVEDLRWNITSRHSKDSLARDLFPLSRAEQRKYRFKLLGEETFDGRKVYRLRFAPRDKNKYTWAGATLVDAQEFEPVSIYTRLARRLPFAVRTLLGTNFPGLGFNVDYQRLAKGVWFPQSFGTEFGVRMLFFFNREITISGEDSGFERTHVNSRVLGYKPST